MSFSFFDWNPFLPFDQKKADKKGAGWVKKYGRGASEVK
jgi:hypothetical protein